MQGVTGNYTHNGKPDFITSLTPYIIVKDAKRAIRFYKKVFKVVEIYRNEVFNEHKEKITLYAILKFDEGHLHIGELMNESQLSAPHVKGSLYSLGVYVTDVDETMKQAVKSGAQVCEEAMPYMFGDYVGVIEDPFGVQWSIKTRMKDLSLAESYPKKKR